MAHSDPDWVTKGGAKGLARGAGVQQLRLLQTLAWNGAIRGALCLIP